MKSFTFVIQDPQGIHARPAGMLAKTAAAYQSDITIATPNGTADAKRLMAIMRLAAKAGMEITISCAGADEDAAAAGMEQFLKDNL